MMEIKTACEKTRQAQLTLRLLPAAITGLGLALATYAIDFVLEWLGTSASKTLLNDVAIGLLGALAVYFYLGASQQRESFECVKQRMRLMAELNGRVREALGMMANSAILEDRVARLRGIDEANERIDSILSDIYVTPQAEEEVDSHQMQLECSNQ